jgi:predicted GTPase
MDKKRILILGAAGRDFHDFNVVFRDDPSYEVVAFTATQIPGIGGRVYPPTLAGEHYPEGIPIEDEARLEELIASEEIQEVVFSYSDVPHVHVMNVASRVLACGADFRILGPHRTQLTSSLPVLSFCAVRTGCGKSQTTRYVARLLKDLGRRPVVIRHPMPYGDLTRQAVQRFETARDLEEHRCTIEEREEYEPHLAEGTVVFAGADYEGVLRSAEAEADVILWDGGNNDLSFLRSDLSVVLMDPLRGGHEEAYHPGEANVRAADLLLIVKVDEASPEQVTALRENLRRLNPTAPFAEVASPVRVEDPEQIRGRRVLVVEDGPTMTHGGMAYGAGTVAARRFAAGELVDPRPFAVGSIARTLEAFPHLDRALPAMGYGPEQLRDLEATIEAAEADAVVIGTPIDLGRLLDISKPTVRVHYALEERGEAVLSRIVRERFSGPGP